LTVNKRTKSSQLATQAITRAITIDSLSRCNTRVIAFTRCCCGAGVPCFHR